MTLIQSPEGSARILEDLPEVEVPVADLNGTFDIDSLLPTTVSKESTTHVLEVLN